MTLRYQRHVLLLMGMALYWPGTFQESCLIPDRWAYSPCDHSVSPDTSQNSMLEARDKLRPLMKTSSTSGSSWRNDSTHFLSGAGPQGTVDLSPAWFQQARDVSASVHELYSLEAHFESENHTRIPTGFCELQKSRCIGLARLHLRIQCSCECNPGGNPPQTL